MKIKRHSKFIKSGLITTVLLSGLVLSSALVFADNTDVVDEVTITVPVSCTMSGTGMTSHTEEIANGTYESEIGTTTLHAFCNDNSGFAIYAAGYTGNEIGGTNSNKLVGTSASGNATIETGLATSAGNPDVSNWAMKLTKTQDSGDITGTNAFTIDSAPNTSGGADASFSQYHVVPNRYTKVAHKNSNTDMTASTGGVKLTTTYAAYISKTQPADTYTGQVIYTLVHPASQAAPIVNPATLDVGQTVNSKLKSLAASVVSGNETTVSYNTSDNYIKSINVHLETPTPSGFTPSTANTISSSTSKKPIYIVFDNTNNAGIMHFYTEGETIVLSADSSNMFKSFFKVYNLSAISSWDTSNVTDMSYMFVATGTMSSIFDLDLSSWNTSSVTNMSHMFDGAGSSSAGFELNLSDWDTSSVTDMSYMFYETGYDANSWFINGLSTWDTSSVTDMNHMFGLAAYNANGDFNPNLSSWDTSSVTDMSYMFNIAGVWASSFDLDLSSWNTSSVTNISNMFDGAGRSATTWSVTIPQTNGDNISNTASRLYGKTTSTYGSPPSGKSFTLAQP